MVIYYSWQLNMFMSFSIRIVYVLYYSSWTGTRTTSSDTLTFKCDSSNLRERIKATKSMSCIRVMLRVHSLLVWKILFLICRLLWMSYFLFISRDQVQHNRKPTLNENTKVSWHDGALKNVSFKSCTADCSAGPMDMSSPDLELVCQEISLN